MTNQPITFDFDRLWIAAGKKPKEKDYWLKKLSGELSKSSFPCGCHEYENPSYGYDTAPVYFHLRDSLYSGLIKLSNGSDIRLHIVLASALTLLLSKYTGNDDIIIGTSVSHGGHGGHGERRNENEVNQLISTILALRNQLNDHMSFKELLLQVRQTVIEAEENRNYPFEILIRQLNLPETKGTCPLFDVGIVLENIQDRGYFSNLAPKVLFFFSRLENRIECNVQYDTGFYHQRSIKRIADHFQHLLEVIISDIEIKLSEIDLLLPDERVQLIDNFNATAAPYPKDKTIHGLFEDQVNRIGDRIALINEDNSVGADPRVCPQLSYNELDKQSDRLASELIHKGIQPEDVVGIDAHRSIEMITGILGILKAGGAYLPLDPGLPRERVDYILRDSQARLLVTHSVGADPRVCPSVSSLPATGNREPAASLAYVIYTSGSTGKPKGVMVTHRNVSRLIHSNYIQFLPQDRLLLTGAMAFDITTFEIWGPLLNGITLVLASKEMIVNAELLKRVLINHRVSILHLIPQLFNQMAGQDIDLFCGLRYFLVGGDLVNPGYINQLRERYVNLKILHMYGPTENTTFSTSFLVDKQYEAKIPIGKPIANSTAYIVDQFERLQPIGVAGELWVGGDGVARGYLNHPELTFERFRLRRPGALFEKTAPGPRKNVWFGRLYNTGDWCRWLEDGNIEFLGRIDHQVKIRGFRVEPGEIENRILKHPIVREAVVVVKEDKGGNKSLVSYIVFNNKNNKPDVATLKTDLANNLPDYMIPSFFVPVDHIPLTTNGKVDWRALPEPQVNSAKGQDPRNDGEEKMATLWAEVLGLDKDRLSIDSDFFELGGHSLKAALLVSKIHQAFHITVPLSEVFTSPTIRKLSDFIRCSSIEKFDPINSVEKKEYYALSSAQKRLYILHQMDEKGIAYNMPVFFILEGDVDKERLERAFQLLVNRHESLRTSFQMIDGEPVQRVEEDSLTVLTGDTEGEKKKLRREEVGKIRKIDHFVKYFDLRKAPLMRVGLLRLDANKHLLAVDMHHIISDGTSMNIMVNDFMALYRGESLPQLEIQYKDYSEWQHIDSHKALLKQQEVFWLHEFEDEIPVLELPTDFTRPSVQSFEGNTISFTLNREITDDLKAMVSETETTLYMLLLSLYTLFLSTLTHQEDIAVGSPVAGRRRADLENIIGMFVNTLAIRNFPLGEQTFREFLSQVKEKTLLALENQDYPYENLVERVIPHRDASRNPLFDTMFAWQNLPMQPLEIPGLTLSPYDVQRPVSKFDLTLSATESNDQLVFLFEYSTALFKPETIECFIIYFKHIIDQAVENKDKKISEFEIITEEEKKRILYEFNDTDKTYPNDKTLQELFVDQVKKTPDHLALISRTSVGALREAPPQISYRELDHQSDRLACELIEKGVAPDTIVALKIERSMEMIIGILGILKAGGAYLPIDPGLPQDRINYMLKDSQARLLVTHFVGADPRVCPYAIEESGAHMGAPLHLNKNSNLAYIIYTSGSTGKPKGVLIRHSNVCPLLHWGYETIGLNCSDRSAQNLSYYFDWSVWEIFITLTSGAGLWMVPGNVILNAIEYVNSLNRYGITVLHITPTHFQSLIHSGMRLRTLRHLCIGAEKFSKELAELIPTIVDEKCRVYNMYGPTEATIMAAVLEIDKSKSSYQSNLSVPIGKNLGNNMLLILDRNFNLCPVGIAGELVIGGDGVAPGYLNNPESTYNRFFNLSHNKSFCPAFFKKGMTLSPGRAAGGNIYKTGDLCRWLEDGNVEYLNRIDQQVKIRGFRIELGEIENRLLKHDSINGTVVLVKEDKNKNNYLSAYYVSEVRLESDELRDYLSAYLPNYMIPSYFVFLDKLPLTPNGKVDLNALPEPALTIDDSFIAPRNETEKTLTHLWSEILAQPFDKIGIDDHFFELGGHSFKAAMMMSKIRDEFNVNIPLADILKMPTIRELASLLSTHEETTALEPVPIEEREYYDLSFNQKRLWVIHQLQPESVSFNMPGKIELRHAVDETLIKKSVEKLLERHESLRTGFKLIDGEGVQFIEHRVKLPFQKIDISSLNDNQREHERERVFMTEQQTPFDLTRPPLFRCILLKVTDACYDFIFNMHHIISDGWSLEILKKEFSLYYNGLRTHNEYNPEKLKIQYKDFAALHTPSFLDSPFRKSSYRFWKQKLTHWNLSFELPVDPLGNRNDLAGSGYRYLLDERTKDELNALARENRASLFMVLFSVYLILLSRISNRNHALCSIITSGRGCASLQPIMGFFVNSLLFGVDIDPEKDFTDFLEEVNRHVGEVFQHQDYPVEPIFKELKMKYPEVPVSFNFINISEESAHIQINDAESGFRENVGDVKFDIEVYATEYRNGILLNWVYKQSLFSPSTIEYIVQRYIDLLMYFKINPHKDYKSFAEDQNKNKKTTFKKIKC
ncbi:MAG: amino acid adenylation domain-containing protein [Candidatus Omnitrophota bacterium]